MLPLLPDRLSRAPAEVGPARRALPLGLAEDRQADRADEADVDRALKFLFCFDFLKFFGSFGVRERESKKRRGRASVSLPLSLSLNQPTNSLSLYLMTEARRPHVDRARLGQRQPPPDLPPRGEDGEKRLEQRRGRVSKRKSRRRG